MSSRPAKYRNSSSQPGRTRKIMDVSLFAGLMRVNIRPSSGIRTTGREKGLSIGDSGTTGSLLWVQGDCKIQDLIRSLFGHMR